MTPLQFAAQWCGLPDGTPCVDIQRALYRLYADRLKERVAAYEAGGASSPEFIAAYIRLKEVNAVSKLVGTLAAWEHAYKEDVARWARTEPVGIK